MRHVSKTSASTSSACTSSSRTGSPRALTFYPAYCNAASATWDTWVKLTAHDIHHVLRPRPGTAHFNYSNAYKDGLVLFYLNHPIQLVQIVGVVVAIDEHNEWFWLFTIDDSSGETIEVTCPKPVKAPPEPVDPETKKKEDLDVDEDEIKRLAILPTLDIGTIVQAKGSVRTFRNVRQLQLKRLIVVADTQAETLLIEARTKTLTSILSTPWVLSAERQGELLKQAQGEVQAEKSRATRAREREKRRLEREERHARKIRTEYQDEGAKMQKAAEEARQAGRRLKTSTLDR